jgi:MoaA/NifB/PqqE/SkfB family radical SAM enzyme
MMLSLYLQGEPLMQNNFAELVEMAAKRKIYTQTSTNGQLLTEPACRSIVNAGLDRIIVSLDGTDQETYARYRKGGRYAAVEDGIRTLSRVRRESRKSRPLIIVQFLVFNHNRHQAELVKQVAREMGADRVWIKSAQLEYPDTAEDFIPDGGEYGRYEKDSNGEWKRRGRPGNRCRRLWDSMVITSDWIIVPCCFDKHAAYPMGFAGEQDLAAVWKGSSYRDFRKRVYRERGKISICTNCTEGFGRNIRRS